MNYKDWMDKQRLSEEQRRRIADKIEAAGVELGDEIQEDSGLRETPRHGKGFAAIAFGLAAVLLLTFGLGQLLPVILQQGNKATDATERSEVAEGTELTEETKIESSRSTPTEALPVEVIEGAEEVLVLNQGFYTMRQNGKVWSWVELKADNLLEYWLASDRESTIASRFKSVDGSLAAVDDTARLSWRALTPSFLQLENPPDQPYLPQDRLWIYTYERGFAPEAEETAGESDFNTETLLTEPVTYRANAGTAEEAYFTIWPDGRFRIDRNIAVSWIPEGFYELEAERLVLKVSDGSSYVFRREDDTLILTQARDPLIAEGTVFTPESDVPEIFREPEAVPNGLIVLGSYHRVTDKIEEELRLNLLADGTYSVSFSPISSYIQTGRYEVRLSESAGGNTGTEVVLIAEGSPASSYAAVFTIQDGSLLCTDAATESYTGALQIGNRLEGGPLVTSDGQRKVVVAAYPYTSGLSLMDYSQIEEGDAGSVADLASQFEQLVLIRFNSQETSLDVQGQVVTKSSVSALDTFTPEYSLPDVIYSYGGVIKLGDLQSDTNGSAADELVQVTYAGIGTPQPGAVALVALRQEADGSWWLCQHEYAASLLLTPWTAEHHDLDAPDLAAVNNSYGNPRRYPVTWLTEQLLPDREETEPTGYIDSGLQRPSVFYGEQLWEQSTDERLQHDFEEAFRGPERELNYLGKTVAEDHKSWPDEELEAARVLVGSDVYYDSKNDVVYIHIGERMIGFQRYTPE